MHFRHSEALRLASGGVPVIPITAPYDHVHTYNAKGKCTICATFKVPVIKWQEGRTKDPDQINRWWSEAAYNIAIVPADAGLTIIDLDSAEGSRSWAALCTELGFSPDAPMVRTPSGGLHLYYAGTTMRPSAGQIAKGVDVRSEDSYVLVPPSEIGGNLYHWL